MKNSILLFLFLIPAFLFAQYPTTGNKSRLGWQTTGDGLIWRGVAGDTVNKPNNRNYPYFQLDTVNAVLYRYIATQGNWQAVGGGSIDIDSTLFATIAGVGDSIAAELSAYLPIADTAAMLLNYPSTAGYGIIDGGKTWRADTTSPNGLATRLFAKTLPTSILSGQVAYSNGSNLVGSANHYWDNSNVRLGIGTSTPSHPIDIQRNLSSSAILNIANINNGASADTRIQVQPSSNTSVIAQFGKTNALYAGYKSILANDAFIYNTTVSGNINLFNDYASGRITMTTGGGSTAQWTLMPNGNNLIGTTTDVATSILTARSTTKSSSPFPLHTLAESDAITGVQGNFDYETTQNGLRWYNGTRKAYALESTFARGTATRVPFFDANGQVTDDAGMSFTTATDVFNITSNGSGESSILIDALGSGNAGTIAYTGTQAYTVGLSITANANKFISIFPSGLGLLSKVSNIPGQYAGGTSYVLVGGMGVGNGEVSFGGTATSTRFGSIALTHANDGNFGTTAYAASLLVRGGTALTSVGGVGNGGDLLLIGGDRLNSSSTYGHVILAHNGTTSYGNVGVKQVNPTEDFQVNGDVYLQDSTRLTTTPAHTAITGLLTRDANGWVGSTGLSGLSYSGGTLTAQNIGNTDLSLTANRTLTGGAYNLTLNAKTKIGSDSSFVHDPVQDTTFYKGNIRQNGNILTQAGTNAGRDFPNIIYFKSDAAYSVAGTSYANPGTGQFNWYLLNDQRGYGEDGFGIKNENLHYGGGIGSYVTLFTIRNNGNVELGYPYNSHYSRVNSDTFMVSPTYVSSPEIVINTAPFYVVGHTYPRVVAQSKFYIGTDSTFKFDPNTDLLQLSTYGTPATTAAALSKTLTNYGVGFATDGTVTSREIKRDTTIYVDDADYDFSAAITTAQIASRFNRVIFWMTTTAAAGTDSELTLHTPDVNLMQVEYLIHSVDEAGGFDNRIIFGTNNAVDSTNGLVTNYYPAAGDGIHIRAGLRSGVYKYRYSN